MELPKGGVCVAWRLKRDQESEGSGRMEGRESRICSRARPPNLGELGQLGDAGRGYRFCSRA